MNDLRNSPCRPLPNTHAARCPHSFFKEVRLGSRDYSSEEAGRVRRLLVSFFRTSKPAQADRHGRRKMRVALWPPKAKLLVMATETAAGRAWLGT